MFAAMIGFLDKLSQRSSALLILAAWLAVWPNSASAAQLFDQLLVHSVCVNVRGGEKTDTSRWAPGEINTGWQQQRGAVKLVFLYFHVSAVMRCHILQLFSFAARYLSLCRRSPRALKLSALWSPCPNRFGWSPLVVVYVCTASVRLSVCLPAHTWESARGTDAPHAAPLLSVHARRTRED